MKDTFAVIFASVFACAPIYAQNPAPAKMTGPDSSAMAQHKATVAGMKSALRNLITAEEKYWNTHGTYTTEGSALGIFPATGGQPLAQVIFAGSRGWTGMTTDRAVKGESCVIYIGNEKEFPGGVPKTMARGVAPKDEGVPACDVNIP